MPTNLERRLAALEAQSGMSADTIEIVETFIRADGTQYTTRATWSRAEHEAWCEQQEQKLQEYLARLDPDSVDPSKGSINDLLAAGYYREVVRRIDTWHEWTSASLPLSLVKLADALRPAVTEGRT